MCWDVDQSLIVAALVLTSILALLLCFRLWIACADYLLRRRVTLRQYAAGRFDRFERGVFKRLFPLVHFPDHHGL